MAQNKRSLKSAGLALMLSAMVLSISSCIDQLYDMNNGISMEMELGGDSLAIPIGSTDTIMLKDYLDASTISMLKTMEDGGYAVTIKDSLEPEIPAIPQDKLKIDDQKKSISTRIDFGDINLDGFEIKKISKETRLNLNFGSYSLGTFPIGPFTGSLSKNAGLNKYTLSTPAISIDPVETGKNDLFSGVPDPPSGQTGEISVSNQSITINSSENISSSAKVPDGVTNIRNIEMQSGVMQVTIELVGASDALTNGELVPNITINPHGLFVFSSTPNDSTMNFGSNEKLTKSNQYKVTKSSNIVGLGISGSPIGENLPISGAINVNGEMELTSALVNAANFPAFKGLDVKVTISVNNMVISSMVFDVPNQSFTAENQTPLEVKNNSIPSQIDSIGSIYFTDPSIISFEVIPNQYMKAINSKVDEFSITFPREFIFDDPNHEITYINGVPVFKATNLNLNSKFSKDLKLKELKMSKDVSSGLNWNSAIDCKGVVSFGGTINSVNLPTGTNDANLTINFTSNLTFGSAEVKTASIPVPDLGVNLPIDLTTYISTMVKQIGTIKLKDSPQIRLDILRPEGLPLSLSADNFKLQFPNFFSFNPEKNPPMPGNILTLNGAIPDSIVLFLDALEFNDELKDGMLTLNDNVSISGKLALVPGWVNSSSISTIAEKEMVVTASTSNFKISSTSIQLNDLSYPYKDSIPLKFDILEVPSQLVSLDSVILNDNATIQLDVNITNMPDFGTPINVDLTIDFPDMFLFKSGLVKDNQLVIKEPFNGKLSKTIGIHGLKFDGNDLNGVLKIDKQLKYNASISVSSPSINSDSLVGKEIIIDVEANIKNIAFKSVYGKLDPNMEPISQDIPLTDITKMLNDNNINVVLDITKPVIAISTECNLGIPIDASVKVTPVRGSTPATAEAQAFTLKLPKAPTPQNLIKTNFWISPDSAGMPTGSEYIKTNVQNLFKIIPDVVKMDASVTTDKSMQHFIDLTADYKFKLFYEVTIPFAFGEDLSIEIQKDIVGLDPKIGEMASVVGGIELLGAIQNSIPLELQLAAIPLDADNRALALDTIKQLINAGAHDGSAVSSKLMLKLADKNDQLKELRGFRLIFNASSNETVAGTPIKMDNFVKADLKVRVDGGINIEKLTNN